MEIKINNNYNKHKCNFKIPKTYGPQTIADKMLEKRQQILQQNADQKKTGIRLQDLWTKYIYIYIKVLLCKKRVNE